MKISDDQCTIEMEDGTVLVAEVQKCERCFFDGNCSGKAPCMPHERYDAGRVIFVKKEAENEAV